MSTTMLRPQTFSRGPRHLQTSSHASFRLLSRSIFTTTARPSPAATTSNPPPKREGNIADSFASLSGGSAPLPDEYRQLKLDIVRGREDKIVAGWNRLLKELRRENKVIGEKGSAVVPQVEYSKLETDVERLREEIKLRGVVVVRGVVPEGEARAYKDEIEEYVKNNPGTNAFPPDNPQVYELYWSAPQLKARAHPNLLRVQHHLMTSLWHSSSPTARISLSQPISYADRLRIRQPGDAAFALGPHMDGGSVERWERHGYGLGGVYDAVLRRGEHEAYDPWDVSGRVDAVTNTHEGLGACSVFRMWQGWLSMSRSGPGEGTLLVNPLMRLATAYMLLRPFFRARDVGVKGTDPDKFLDGDNWEFTGGESMTSELQGAALGAGQEFSDELHPHLELKKTMVHVPDIRPGDFVAWHCDIDSVHGGTSDSSVLYIPICPVTAQNARYMVRQRAAFREGTPGPDFPGGRGEAEHRGRWTEDELRRRVGGGGGNVDGGVEGLKAMGLERLSVEEGETEGGRRAVEDANAILGF